MKNQKLTHKVEGEVEMVLRLGEFEWAPPGQEHTQTPEKIKEDCLASVSFDVEQLKDDKYIEAIADNFRKGCVKRLQELREVHCAHR